MGGMGWDGYPNEWMAESPEAKPPNGRVCPMAGRQNACHMGMGKEKDRKRQKKTEKNKALNHPSSDEHERERER